MESFDKKLNCIAVDDEPLALQQMEGFISKVAFLHLMQTFDNGLDALNFVKTHAVDLVFLDVEMDAFSGIQFLEVLDKKPVIILTTAYESYAIKGYELEVSDYLLKPISYQRFLKAVSRAYDKFAEKESENSTKNEVPSHSFMFVKTEHQLQKIFFHQVLFIKALSNYLIIYTELEKVYVLMNFKELERLLPQEKFFRIHKSYVVALDKMDKINKNQVQIHDHSIPIGLTYKNDFFKALESRNII